MGRVFFILTTLSLMLALLTNRAPSAASALLNSAESGVSLMLTLLGTMTLWSGLMEVLLRTGDVAKLGLLIRKLFGRHSRALPDADCWEAVGMNLAANVLGLGNAATPPGVSAAKKLAVHGEPGLRVLALLLRAAVIAAARALAAALPTVHDLLIRLLNFHEFLFSLRGVRLAHVRIGVIPLAERSIGLLHLVVAGRRGYA